MPIKVQKDLPARAVLEEENIFIMDEDRALSQDIRPLEILILNLMPIKEETETQLLRALSNTPLQVDCTFLMMTSHVSKNTSASHLNKFYVEFADVKRKKYDGMIITRAPVELLDYEEVNYWPELSRNILLLIMFVGACAGSTGGGIKVSRIIILVKSIGQELRHFIHPRSVTKITVDRKVVSSESLRGIYAFLAAYLLIFVISVLLVSLDNLDGITNISAVASAFNSIGPGLNEVGPLANFSVYSNFSTFILTMDMLAGRLEIFPLLLLFTPETWKKF